MYNIYFYFYIPCNMLTINKLLSATIQLIPLCPTSHLSPPLPSPNHYSGLCNDVALWLKKKNKAI